MTTAEQELAPLTELQIKAIKACRFTTCTLELGWMWTDDEKIVEALEPITSHKDKYTRDWTTRKQEWEIRSWNPHVMALIRSQYQ